MALSWSPQELEKQLLQIYVCLAIQSTLTECEGNTAAFGFAMEELEKMFHGVTEYNQLSEQQVSSIYGCI